MERARLTRPELEILRRSAACGGLPDAELTRLLAETARLLHEREELADVAARLTGPWRDVRQALNDLHRVLNDEAPT